MLIEEIDVIGSQTLETGLCHCFNMLGLAVGAASTFARFKIDVEPNLVAITTSSRIG